MMFDHRPYDEAFVQQLGQLGMDIQCPQIVEHFFYFLKPDWAELAELELRSQGYTAEVSAESRNGAWSVVARGQLMPRSDAISKIRSCMEQLAMTFGGSYDGWEFPFCKRLH